MDLNISLTLHTSSRTWRRRWHLQPSIWSKRPQLHFRYASWGKWRWNFLSHW